MYNNIYAFIYANYILCHVNNDMHKSNVKKKAELIDNIYKITFLIQPLKSETQ